MKTAVNAGVTIGIFVVLWTFLLGFTGWYKDPSKMSLFWVVIPMQTIILVWMMRKTAREGNMYGAQVLAAVVASVVAGVIVFVGSWIFTSMVFPNYFSEVRVVGEKMLAQQGRTPEEIKTILDAQAPMQTSFVQACLGFVGTLLTGLLTGLIGGAFIRNRGPAAASPAPARA